MNGLRWTPGIGDPTFTGWLTVFAYFFSAWLCLRAFMMEKSGPPRPYWDTIRALFRVLLKNWGNPPLPAKRSALWLGLGFSMAALGVNKQLDLQTLFTDIGRLVATYTDWYEERRYVQAAFILGIGAAGVFLLTRLFRLARGPLRDFRAPFFGLTIVVAFVLIRAASFHHMDILLGDASFGSYLNFFFESTGIFVIGVSAFLRIRRP
jgi:hypothetical protein